MAKGESMHMNFMRIATGKYGLEQKTDYILTGMEILRKKAVSMTNWRIRQYIVFCVTERENYGLGHSEKEYLFLTIMII